METNANDPATGYTMISPDGSNHLIETGLTKREHMAIEFTKAIISNGCEFGNQQIVCEALKFTDELIKQLNNPLNQQHEK